MCRCQCVQHCIWLCTILSMHASCSTNAALAPHPSKQVCGMLSRRQLKKMHTVREQDCGVRQKNFLRNYNENKNSADECMKHSRKYLFEICTPTRACESVCVFVPRHAINLLQMPQMHFMLFKQLYSREATSNVRYLRHW